MSAENVEVSTENAEYERCLKILGLERGFTLKKLRRAFMRVQSTKKLLLQVPASTDEGKIALINEANTFLRAYTEEPVSAVETPTITDRTQGGFKTTADIIIAVGNAICENNKDKIPLSEAKSFKINQLCSMMGVEANEENRNKVLSEVVDLVEFMAKSGVLSGLKALYSGENAKDCLRWKSKDHFEQAEKTIGPYMEKIMLGGFETDILRMKKSLSQLYKGISIKEYHVSAIIALSIDVLYKLVGAMRSRGEKIFLAASERSKFTELPSLEERLWLRLHPKKSTEDAQMYLLELWPYRIAE